MLLKMKEYRDNNKDKISEQKCKNVCVNVDMNIHFVSNKDIYIANYIKID
jgi:hypothetical protein